MSQPDNPIHFDEASEHVQNCARFIENFGYVVHWNGCVYWDGDCTNKLARKLGYSMDKFYANEGDNE